MIRLVVGLGNPGHEYIETRHNAGFWLVDSLALKLGVKFSLESKFFAEVAKTKQHGHDLWLIKPQTYMNLSGKAVHTLTNFYKIMPNEILVAHDELDFQAGITKLKCGGGNGGHNGLKDIDRVIGKDYWRLRIGIGHPGDVAKVANYVLNRPQLDDLIAIKQSLDKVLTVSDFLLKGDFAHAQKTIHTK